MNNWTTEKPTKPGWYWCRNHRDNSEFVCRIDGTADLSEQGAGNFRLTCSWMTAPGYAAVLHEEDWADDVLWCGPLEPPASEADDG